MGKEYNISGYTIMVSFKPGVVHITNDKALEFLLSKNPDEAVKGLIRLIKGDYLIKYNKALRVSDDSMLIEIYGHVYFEYFTVLATRIFPLQITDKLAGWVIKRCEIIDSGEEGVDKDRRFWNSLVPFKEAIMTILSKMPVR
jgi:hypothetical protein